MRVRALPLEGDTIAAISTPFGVGGIGIVRMSGPDAEPIARGFFRPRRPTPALPSHRFLYGHIIDPRDGSSVDEVLVVFMRAPSTYTREDVVEIHCHGGGLPVQRILELALAGGARLADPGEFTRRAFLNGRIDLVQAEAVADVVSAKTDTALRFAQRHLAGGLSGRIEGLREALRGMLVEVEAWLDFPEEDLPGPDVERLRGGIGDGVRRVEALLDTYAEGHLYRDGVTLVIGGKPNVGKSTLLNVLVGRERAIVSPEPGTTRDFVEESISLGGIPLRLVDTAGLRDAPGEVESRGVDLARRQIETADLLLLVVDVSRFAAEGWSGSLADAEPDRTLVVVNKIDRVDAPTLEAARRSLREVPNVAVSALNGDGIEGLLEEILRRLTGRGMDLDSRAVVTNLRHRNALAEVRACLGRAEELLTADPPPGDLLAADLRRALRSLGEIVGETTPEEILDRIFEAFCIGK